MSVMVVVPAFTKAQKSDPPEVAGIIAGSKTLRTPHVRGRVHQPGAVQEKHRAQEDTPEHELPAAHGEKDEAEDDHWNPVPFADPDVEFVFAKVGNVRKQTLELVVHRLAAHDPTHVRPVAAVTRSVRIACFVGDLMVNTVGGDPEDGSALEGERAADCQEIFKPLRTLEAAMSEQPMIAKSDAETASQPVQEKRGKEGAPTKHEEGSDRPNVEYHHCSRSDPVNLLVLSNHETSVCYGRPIVRNQLDRGHRKTTNFGGNAL